MAHSGYCGNTRSLGRRKEPALTVRIRSEIHCSRGGTRAAGGGQTARSGGRRLRMNEEKHSSIKWMDLLWLVFLLGLAVLPPVQERHKQLALLAIGVVQLAEGRIIAKWPRSGPSAVVLVKIRAGHAADQPHGRAGH